VPVMAISKVPEENKLLRPHLGSKFQRYDSSSGAA
jgi:hypothetical protein